MSGWGSPFANIGLDLVSKTLKTVEKSIDKAIGIPEGGNAGKRI